MKIKNISASGFDVYSDCQWRYFLQYALYQRSDAGPAAAIGTLAHKVFELLGKASIVKHRKDSKIWDFSYLWEICFNRYYKSIGATEGIKDDKLRKVCKGMHELLKGRYTPVSDKTIAVEVPFEIPLEDPKFLINAKGQPKEYFKIRGRIDRVDKIDDETIEIIDFKSGSRDIFGAKIRQKKDAIYLYEKEIQPKLYHLASTHLYGWAKNVLVTFIYFTDGGAVTIPFSPSDIENTKNILFRRYNAIKANNDPQRTRSWKCTVLCDHGKSGQCDAIWQEKQQVGLQFLEQKYTILNYKGKK